MIQYTMFHFNRTNGSEITVVWNLDLEIWGQGHVGGGTSNQPFIWRLFRLDQAVPYGVIVV